MTGPMSKLSKVSSQAREHPGNPDKVFISLSVYQEVQPSMNLRAPPDAPSDDSDEYLLLLGMRVIIGPPYDNEVYVLDSSDYPTAGDFKEGRAEPIPLSVLESY